MDIFLQFKLFLLLFLSPANFFALSLTFKGEGLLFNHTGL